MKIFRSNIYQWRKYREIKLVMKKICCNKSLLENTLATIFLGWLLVGWVDFSGVSVAGSRMGHWGPKSLSSKDFGLN